MTNEKIKQILINSGVSHLYHANTVGTACTYINNYGLLSRGAVRDLGLFQTPQATDASDQAFDIFYDIFFDSVDIHHRSHCLNYYGPVTFEFSIELLDSLPADSIKITKCNPKYWDTKTTEGQKYFLSETELARDFIRGNFGQHITIKDQHSPLPFDHLERIILDDPHLDDNRCFRQAYTYLLDLLEANSIRVPLVIRSCDADCGCVEKYGSYHPYYINTRFNPKQGG